VTHRAPTTPSRRRLRGSPRRTASPRARQLREWRSSTRVGDQQRLAAPGTLSTRGLSPLRVESWRPPRATRAQADYPASSCIRCSRTPFPVSSSGCVRTTSSLGVCLFPCHALRCNAVLSLFMPRHANRRAAATTQRYHPVAPTVRVCFFPFSSKIGSSVPDTLCDLWSTAARYRRRRQDTSLAYRLSRSGRPQPPAGGSARSGLALTSVLFLPHRRARAPTAALSCPAAGRREVVAFLTSAPGVPTVRRVVLQVPSSRSLHSRATLPDSADCYLHGPPCSLRCGSGAIAGAMTGAFGAV
jgi:hypothetical protein